MAFTLSCSRARLLAHWDEPLAPVDQARFRAYVERRAAGEPVAYIRKLKEFMGLDLHVDPRVLIPRPETELLVHTALRWIREQSSQQMQGRSPCRGLGCPQNFSANGGAGLSVADVGTGSGAIAISLLKHCADLTVIATDASADALAVARLNAERHGVQPHFLQGDLLEPVEAPVDLVVANLPYLTQSEYEGLLHTSIGFEPRMALTDGADGLTFYKRLLAQVQERAIPAVLLELGPPGVRELLPKYRATTFDGYVLLLEHFQEVLGRA